MKNSSVLVGACIYRWMREGHLYTTEGEKLGRYDEVDLGLEDGTYTFDNLQTDHRGYTSQLSYEFRGEDYDMKEVIIIVADLIENGFFDEDWTDEDYMNDLED